MSGFHQLWQEKRDGHIQLFSRMDLNVGDVFYAILILLIIWQLTKLFWLKKGLKPLLELVIGLNFSYLVYFILWGNLYSTPPLTEQMPPIPKENTERLMVAVLQQKIIQANNIRTGLDEEIYSSDEAALVYRTADAVQKASGNLNFITVKPLPKMISVKDGLAGKWQAYTGISGYYNPFTAEATVNFHQPKTVLAFTTAHEMAHQMGFARESEASFMGYLMAQQSDDQVVRYGADLFVIELILYNLSQRNKPLAKKMKATLSSEILQDMAKEKVFYTQHKGWISALFGWTNDLFLKSNRQRGALSYNDALTLILQYHQGDEKGPYLMIQPQKHK